MIRKPTFIEFSVAAANSDTGGGKCVAGGGATPINDAFLGDVIRGVDLAADAFEAEEGARNKGAGGSGAKGAANTVRVAVIIELGAGARRLDSLGNLTLSELSARWIGGEGTYCLT